MKDYHIITFIGTGNYLPCQYTIENFSYSTSLSSVALGEFLASKTEHTSSIRVSVLTTPTARALGKTELFEKEWKLPEKPEFPEIPETGEEEGYWQIFETIRDLSRPNEVIWLDITHSFRYLPMLGFATCQYLQTIRGIEIGKIVYGAAEKLGKIDSVPEKDRIVPIQDLTPFLTVNQWTMALDDFNRNGSAQQIHDLVRQKTLPIKKETRGKDESANALDFLARNLLEWSEDIYTVRGPAIQQSKLGERIPEQVNQIRPELVPALQPEFRKMERLFGQLKEGHVSNLFFAADWCREKGLVQQGWTFLQEGLITYFEESWQVDFENVGIRQRDHRKWATSLLAVSAKSEPPENWDKPLSQNLAFAKQLHATIPPCVSEEYRELIKSRNDINHCGFTSNSARASKLIKNLCRSLENLRRELPHLFPQNPQQPDPS
ncbi:MAG: TM1812 family CRISPR-associated protein [Puniceicoccales bacterium]